MPSNTPWGLSDIYSLMANQGVNVGASQSPIEPMFPYTMPDIYPTAYSQMRIAEAMEREKQQGQTHGPRAKTYSPIDWSSLGRGALVGATTDVLGAPMDLFSNALRQLNIDIPDKIIPGTSDNLASKFTNLDYSPEEVAGRMAAGLAFPDVGDLALLGALSTKLGKSKNLIKSSDVPKGGDIIYSGTSGNKAESIYALGEEIPGSPGVNRFGGIFGSFDENVAASHGHNMQRIYTPKHISSQDFRYKVLYGDDKDISKEMDSLINYTDKKMTDDEKWELLDYIVEDSDIYNKTPEMGLERMADLIGSSYDEGEISWRIQGIKGELANRYGYTSVGMTDEHGESILALKGSKLIED